MPVDLTDPLGVPNLSQKLRQLSAEHAPPVPWPEFKRRRLRRRAHARAAHRRQLARIAALGLVMMLGLALRAHWLQAPVQARPSISHLAPRDGGEMAARSAAAQRWLAAQPAEPVIVHVGTRAAVTDLEDRIAWVDDTLTTLRAEEGALERARALQYERDRLINSLAQVRYAETLAGRLP